MTERSSAPSAAERALQAKCLELWQQVRSAFLSRHRTAECEAPLARLFRLQQWLPQDHLRAAVLILLAPLRAQLAEGDREAREEALSEILRLLDEACDGARRSWLKFLAACRKALNDGTEERALLIARCVLALAEQQGDASFAPLREPVAWTAGNGVGNDNSTRDGSEDPLQRCWSLLDAAEDEVLRVQLRQEVERLQQLLRSNRWDPSFLAQRLLAPCRRVEALLLCMERTTAAHEWQRWQLMLCSACYCRREPPEEVLLQCFGWLWSLHEFAADEESAPIDVDAGLSLPAMLSEPARVFGEELAPAPINANQLRRAYELAAVATQLDGGAVADVLRSVHACLACHWSIAAPLAAPLCTLLRELVTAMPNGTSTALLVRALWRVSELWPEPSRNDLAIPLTEGDGAVAGSVRLEAVPVLLAGGLATLTSVRREWFVSREGFATHRAALRRELLLLERGAAAVKVRSVECYSTLLLEFLAAVELEPVHHPFPGDLLWRAHAHLVELLDAAAAWWEALPDAVLMQELRDYSREQSEPLGQVAEAGAADCCAAWAGLARSLNAQVQSFAAVLQVRMRFDFARCTWPCGPEQLSRLQAALTPLLRFLLLDFSLSLEARRQRHLPLTGCLWLRVATMEPLTVELRDDSAREPPSPEQWRELQHRVRKQGAAVLECHETPLGRCFTLSLGSP